jgi:hypothetical protein
MRRPVGKRDDRDVDCDDAVGGPVAAHLNLIRQRPAVVVAFLHEGAGIGKTARVDPPGDKTVLVEGRERHSRLPARLALTQPDWFAHFSKIDSGVRGPAAQQIRKRQRRS